MVDKTFKKENQDVEINGKTYHADTHECYYCEYFWVEELKTDETKIKKIFLWYPLWVAGKFRWFKTVEVKKRLRIVRYSDFDGGWSFQDYWKSWNFEWNIEEIIDIKKGSV